MNNITYKIVRVFNKAFGIKNPCHVVPVYNTPMQSKRK